MPNAFLIQPPTPSCGRIRTVSRFCLPLRTFQLSTAPFFCSLTLFLHVDNPTLVIPLPPAKIHGIWKSLRPFDFDSTYGGFAGQNVSRPDLKAQVLESMKIFLRRGGHESAAIYDETL